MRKPLLCAVVPPIGAPSPASALVCFGRNVLIGGYDISHQTFGPKRRTIITLHRGTPRHEGCRRHADANRGRVTICHLREIR